MNCLSFLLYYFEELNVEAENSNNDGRPGFK